MTTIQKGFAGFTAGRTQFTSLPNQFFSEVLPIIDDLGELKAVLYTFWRLSQEQGDSRYIRLQDALADQIFLEGFPGEADAKLLAARQSFARAAQRGILIEITVDRKSEQETWYFANTQKGRDAVQRLSQGDFEGLIHDIDDVTVGLEKERPHIFLLYEQNIGMLTPMISDKLRQAERDYPANWIYDAFSLAVDQNKRSWAYIQGILQKWAKHGKDRPSQAGRSLAQDGVRDPNQSDDDEPYILR